MDLGLDEVVVDSEEGLVTAEAEEGIDVVEEHSEVGADTEQCIWNILFNPPPCP